MCYRVTAERPLFQEKKMLTINAKVRKDRGKRASRRLRIENFLPAIVYGGASTPILLELCQDSIKNLEVKPEFYRESMLLIIEGREEITVKVQAVQRHPFKKKLNHVDFIVL